MPVYVDNMRARFGRMVLCHMVADSSAELLVMAAAIGVHQRWIQHEGLPTEHFDISLGKRDEAIRRGAIEITKRELVLRLRAKRTETRKDLADQTTREEPPA